MPFIIYLLINTLLNIIKQQSSINYIDISKKNSNFFFFKQKYIIDSVYSCQKMWKFILIETITKSLGLSQKKPIINCFKNSHYDNIIKWHTICIIYHKL